MDPSDCPECVSLSSEWIGGFHKSSPLKLQRNKYASGIKGRHLYPHLGNLCLRKLLDVMSLGFSGLYFVKCAHSESWKALRPGEGTHTSQALRDYR